MAHLNLLVVAIIGAVLLSNSKVGAFPFVENEAAVVNPAEVIVKRSSISAVETLTTQTTEACKREGGFCLIKSECPKDKLSSKLGLCGKDKECCHSLPDSIVDCGQRGGICRSDCKSFLREPLGRCSEGKVCCILV